MPPFNCPVRGTREKKGPEMAEIGEPKRIIEVPDPVPVPDHVPEPEKEPVPADAIGGK